MDTIEKVVASILKYDGWRFGARSTDDARQEIWVCVLEAMHTADPSRGDVHEYLRWQATKRLRRKLARSLRLKVVHEEWETEDTTWRESVQVAERSAELRWRARGKPRAYRAALAAAMVVQGCLIDEAAGAVYHTAATREVRRRNMLAEIGTYFGGANEQRDDGRIAEN
jgi:hypothetical protein